MVSCPSCGKQIRLGDAYSHLDTCPGPAEDAGSEDLSGPSQMSQHSSDSGAGEGGCQIGDDEMVSCPVCRREVQMREMNSHLDDCCESPSAQKAKSSPTRGSPAEATTQRLAPKHIDRLAEELRCTVCMDLYDEPMFLPCGHNFCLVCITGCFRAMQQMMCPLCKAPTWRRQVTANHTLAGIVQAFKGIADASDGGGST